jgi:hypothetical protein
MASENRKGFIFVVDGIPGALVAILESERVRYSEMSSFWHHGSLRKSLSSNLPPLTLPERSRARKRRSFRTDRSYSPFAQSHMPVNLSHPDEVRWAITPEVYLQRIHRC